MTTTTDYKLIGKIPLSTVSTKSLNSEEPMTVSEIKRLMKENCLQMSRCCSLIIGVIIGFFIQCSTLGANFMMTTMYGKEVYLSQSFVSTSLVWCFITSIMGVAVLLFLRSLVVTSFYATNSSRRDSATLRENENFMIQVIENVEQFFAVGSLIGVGVSWTITDVMLGMQSHVMHSLLTVGVALIWCKFAMKKSMDCDSTQSLFDDNYEDDNEEESDSPLLGKEVVIHVV